MGTSGLVKNSHGWNSKKEGGQEKTGRFVTIRQGVSRLRRIGNSSFFDGIPAVFLENAETPGSWAA
jgi:hypothetical protein